MTDGVFLPWDSKRKKLQMKWGGIKRRKREVREKTNFLNEIGNLVKQPKCNSSMVVPGSSIGLSDGCARNRPGRGKLPILCSSREARVSGDRD